MKKEQWKALLLAALLMLLASAALAEEHIHGGMLRWDEAYHWLVCPDCGGQVGVSVPHSWRCDGTPGVCDGCGAPCSLDAVAHAISHSTPYAWVDDERCVQRCEVCGEGAPVAHVVICGQGEACLRCGGSCAAELVQHLITAPAWDGALHWHACVRCGKGLTAPERHVPSAGDPYACAVCGGGIVYEDGVSTWNPLGKLAIYRDGEVVDFTGFERFEGGKFYFHNGIVRDDLVGVVHVDGVWYAFDHGRLMENDMLVPFELGLWAFRGGIVDENITGLVLFNGERFVFAAGRYQRDVNGPWQDPADGRWYEVVDGQVTQDLQM